MEKARYIVEEEKAVNVYARNINPKDYDEMYKGYLYCENEQCMAEIVHQEIQKGKFNRFFRTKPGSEHIEGCQNELIRDGRIKRRASIVGENVNVSESHIIKSLDEAFKKFYKDRHNENDIKEAKKPKKKKKATKTSRDIQPKIVGSAVASGGNDIESVKEPYIYKREASELRESDINTFRIIQAEVDNVRILESEAFIDIIGSNGSKYVIYLGTPFRTSSEQEFRLLKYIKDYIDLLKKNEDMIIITCFGEVISKFNDVQVQLYDYKHFKINNKSFYQMMQIINKDVY